MMEDLEKKLVDLALNNDFVGVKATIESNDGVDIDCTDQTGMTALQQAAFRGNAEMCRYLLDKGADVNSDKHENQYTTLMFGALSGNDEVVQILLDAGAKTDSLNSVNRTAAEMAAFVSQYHIVGIINNFIPSKELLRFTKPSGLEKEPKLPAVLLKPFHRLIVDSNVNPIHVLLQLKKEPDLITHSKSLQKILDMLVLEKMSAHGTHESMALKLHYLSCLLEEAAKTVEKHGSIDSLLKRLSRGRETDGFLDASEIFVRSTLRSFPRAESNLFGMVIRKLSQVEVGKTPTAITVIDEAINGSRMRAEGEECNLCSARKPMKCTGCYQAYYCSQQCQKLHRPTHKRFCKKAS